MIFDWAATYDGRSKGLIFGAELELLQRTGVHQWQQQLRRKPVLLVLLQQQRTMHHLRHWFRVRASVYPGLCTVCSVLQPNRHSNSEHTPDNVTA